MGEAPICKGGLNTLVLGRASLVTEVFSGDEGMHMTYSVLQVFYMNAESKVTVPHHFLSRYTCQKSGDYFNCLRRKTLAN